MEKKIILVSRDVTRIDGVEYTVNQCKPVPVDMRTVSIDGFTVKNTGTSYGKEIFHDDVKVGVLWLKTPVRRLCVSTGFADTLLSEEYKLVTLEEREDEVVKLDLTTRCCDVKQCIDNAQYALLPNEVVPVLQHIVAVQKAVKAAKAAEAEAKKAAEAAKKAEAAATAAAQKAVAAAQKATNEAQKQNTKNTKNTKKAQKKQ